LYVCGGRDRPLAAQWVTYVDFLLPGIFVHRSPSGASQTRGRLESDLTRGVVRPVPVHAMARSAVLAGRTVADLVRTLSSSGCIIAVGVPGRFRFLGGVAGRSHASPSVAAFGSPSA